jgi:hypothetical protein
VYGNPIGIHHTPWFSTGNILMSMEGGREGERERKLKSTKGGMPNIGKVDNTGQLVFEHSLDLHTKIDLLN